MEAACPIEMWRVNADCAPENMRHVGETVPYIAVDTYKPSKGGFDVEAYDAAQIGLYFEPTRSAFRAAWHFARVLAKRHHVMTGSVWCIKSN